MIAMIIEGLNALRYRMQANTYSKISEALGGDNPDDVYKISCTERFKIAIIYFCSLFLSYMLMLIVMTFNFGLFMAAVLGLTFGYFIFGFMKKQGFTKIYSPETDKCCTQID